MDFSCVPYAALTASRPPYLASIQSRYRFSPVTTRMFSSRMASVATNSRSRSFSRLVGGYARKRSRSWGSNVTGTS